MGCFHKNGNKIFVCWCLGDVLYNLSVSKILEANEPEEEEEDDEDDFDFTIKI
jgi:hypothetical protein